MVLLLALGAVFIQVFKEALGIAVAIVFTYLGLTVIILLVSASHLLAHPDVVGRWKDALLTQHGSPMMIGAIALLLLPKLALGLPGFVTGVAVMPLVRVDPCDTL